MSGNSSPQPSIWWALLLLPLCIVTALVTFTPSISTAQDDPTPTPTGPGVITLVADDYSIDILRIWENNDADGHRSENDSFLILDLVIHNNSRSSYCFVDNDFRAYFDGDETEPSDMGNVRDAFYHGRNYPGSISGQCIDGRHSERSFVSYDVDLDFDVFRLRFTPEDEQASVFIWVIWTPGIRDLEFGIQAPQRGESILSTFTPTPSPTLSPSPSNSPTQTTTPTNTVTSTITPTSTQSNTPDPNIRAASGTRYINAPAGTVNIRSAPSTNSRIVGSLSHRDAITITGQTTDGDWYRINYEGEEAWVFADLTSSTRPAVSSGGGGSSGGSGGTNPTVPPNAVCSCAGDTYNCSDFNTHNAAQACFNYCVSQGRGDIHRLDRDNNQIACESLP